MAEEKEPFLARWSRLKNEQPQPVEKKEEAPAKPLPPLDKLTPDSDFSGFMHPKVEDALRRVALKKLFSDPHFNVPDPYEPYSGDWNVGEPIPDEMLATLNQARTLLFGDKQEPKSQEKAAEKPAEEHGPAEQAAGEKPQGEDPGKQDA